MKYNALRAPCDAKDNIDIRIPTFRGKEKPGGCTSSRDFGSQGGWSFLSENL